MSNQVPINVQDDLLELQDYIEILYRTHLSIGTGNYMDNPSLGNVILFDYIEKSRALINNLTAAKEGKNNELK